jgi:hypothetical protein
VGAAAAVPETGGEICSKNEWEDEQAFRLKLFLS